jgi:hypothetical protein
MKFMLLMMTPQDGWEQFNTMAPQAIKAHIDFMLRLNDELAAAGELVDAQGLALPNQAKIVRVDDRGAPVVTDGPFAETKEFLAGYWVVDVETPERAIEIAATISKAPGRDGAPMKIPVELRQVMQAPM